MKFVLLFALFAVSSAQIKWSTIFYDNFDRPDGPLGPNWVTSDIYQTPPLNITNKQACANTQAFGVYKSSITADMVRVSYSFSAQSQAGLETYILQLSDQVSSNPYVVITGSDGGGDRSTPTIRLIDGPAGVSGQTAPLQPNQTYYFESMTFNNYITLVITDSAGVQVASLVNYNVFPSGQSYQWWGVLVGRGEQLDSCIDNVRFEYGSFPSDVNPMTMQQ